MAENLNSKNLKNKNQEFENEYEIKNLNEINSKKRRQ